MEYAHSALVAGSLGLMFLLLSHLRSWYEGLTARVIAPFAQESTLSSSFENVAKIKLGSFASFSLPSTLISRTASCSLVIGSAGPNLPLP